MDIDGENPNSSTTSNSFFPWPNNDSTGGPPPLPSTPFSAAIAAAPAPLAFGVIVPGTPVRTDFVPVDSNKFSMTLTCPGDIPGPLLAVSELVAFCTTPQFPADQGVLWYWQATVAPPATATSTGYTMSPSTPVTSQSTGFALLGALTASRPSAVFATRWSENEALAELLNGVLGASGNAGVVAVTITIGLSVEPLANITNLLNSAALSQSDAVNDKLLVAQKIAADLFRFMQSFDDTNGANGRMAVPVNIFDRWFQRFENRLRRDPYFFLKPSTE